MRYTQTKTDQSHK